LPCHRSRLVAMTVSPVVTSAVAIRSVSAGRAVQGPAGELPLPRRDAGGEDRDSASWHAWRSAGVAGRVSRTRAVVWRWGGRWWPRARRARWTSPVPGSPLPDSALVRGHLVRPPAWLIFAALLAVLGYLLLRHEQDPLQDLARSRPDDGDAPPGTRPATSGQDEPLADKWFLPVWLAESERQSRLPASSACGRWRPAARLTCRQLGEMVQGHRGGRAAPFGSKYFRPNGPGACAGAAACAGRQSQNLPGACMISMPNLRIHRLRAVPRSRTASPLPAGRRPSRFLGW